MDFSLTEDQKMLKTMVADFAAKELEPIAAQIDEESRFPAESIPRMAGLGFPASVLLRSTVEAVAVPPSSVSSSKR